MSDASTMTALPIVDAHVHFWDPTINYYPWLVDEPPVPFRYGNYATIRRPYLPEEYVYDRAEFDLAFDSLSAGCNSCHRTLDHGFIVIQRPTLLPYSNQNFAPQK